MRIVAFIAAIGLTGCSSLSDSQSRLGQQDQDSCKIEGSSIGHEGLILNLGSRAVRFHDWVPKTGSPGEYVGFSITLSGTSSIGYVVKAATQTYPSGALTWLHPDGQSGHGISNVDFCENCEDGSCDGGGEEECECDENGENCTEPPGDDDDGGDGPLQ